MNILVGGVNGVGKSTILRRVTQLDQRFEVIHLTSALMQALGLAPGSYDALHQVPDSDRDAAMAKLINDLADRRTNKIRLLDGHYLYLVWGKVHILTGSWVKRLDALVLMSARPEVIWRRINQDEAYRDRELFDPQAPIEQHQQQLVNYITLTHHEFEHICNLYQKEHFVLEHDSDDVDRAANQIINFALTLRS